MNRCDELARTMPIYYKGKGNPITCTSNLPRITTPTGCKRNQNAGFAFPRKNNQQKRDEY